MNFYTRLGIYGFVAIVISGMFALMVYDVSSTPAVPLPSEPNFLKSMSAPDATSLSEFRDKMARARWIDRPFRELTDLLGPGRPTDYSCNGSKGFIWVLSRRSVEHGSDPAGAHVVEILDVSADGFGPVVTDISKIASASIREFRYSN